MTLTANEKNNVKVKRQRKQPVLIREEEEPIVMDAYDLIYLDREYVEEKYFSHLEGKSRRSAANRLLRKLCEGQYLASVPLDPGYINSSLVYTFGKKGAEVIERLTGEQVVFDSRYVERVPTTIRHILEVGSLNKAIKKIAENSDIFKIREWINERRSAYQYGETKHDRIEPDAVILTWVKGHPFPFFLEWERSRQRPEVSQKKFRHYARYGAMAAYNSQMLVSEQIKPRIMVVCPSLERVLNMIRTISTIQVGMSGVILGVKEEVLYDPLGAVWLGLGSTDPEQRYRFWEPIK